MINKLTKLLAGKQRLAASKPAAPKFLDDDFPAFVPDSQSKVRTDEASLGNDAVSRWLAGLDESIRPVELPISYHRIALHLALHWPETDLLYAYLQGLILDPRPDRQGFPKAIMTELLRLQSSVMNRREEALAFTRKPHGTR